MHLESDHGTRQDFFHTERIHQSWQMTHRDRIPNYPANLINTDQRKGKQARESLVVVQALSRVRLFVGQWTAAHKASLSFTISRSLLKFMSIKSMMPSNCLISCHPLLLPPSVFPSIRVFSNESALSIRWPKDWSFRFSISPSNEYSVLIAFRIEGFGLLAVESVLYFLWYSNGISCVSCLGRQILYH